MASLLVDVQAGRDILAQDPNTSGSLGIAIRCGGCPALIPCWLLAWICGVPGRTACRTAAAVSSLCASVAAGAPWKLRGSIPHAPALPSWSARSEAVEVAAGDPAAKYALGSVLNHVLLHQTVIGEEALQQL